MVMVSNGHQGEEAVICVAYFKITIASRQRQCLISYYAHCSRRISVVFSKLIEKKSFVKNLDCYFDVTVTFQHALR